MTGRPDLWLVRHGETEWSRDHRHTGRTDLPLTDHGREAATSLRPRLAETAFDLVLTSPLQRARDTAALAGFGEALHEPDAQEWDYGDVEGLTTAQMRESVPGWSVWREGPTGGETADDVGVRCDRLIDRVVEQAADRALLFAHGHLLRILTARWLEQPASAGARFLLGTATVSVLGWERETRAISRWNA